MSSVVSPDHYKGFSNGAEVIDITENLSFNSGNAVKYHSRAGKKDGADALTDLHKALWYTEREIKRIADGDVISEAVVDFVRRESQYPDNAPLDMLSVPDNIAFYVPGVPGNFYWHKGEVYSADTHHMIGPLEDAGLSISDTPVTL